MFKHKPKTKFIIYYQIGSTVMNRAQSNGPIPIPHVGERVAFVSEKYREEGWGYEVVDIEHAISEEAYVVTVELKEIGG